MGKSTINIDNLLEGALPEFAISSADFRTQYVLASEIVSHFQIDQTISEKSFPVYATAEVVRKSRFIEAILVGIPQPTLFFDGSDKQWIPINCAKFTESLCQFVSNRFPLRGQYFLGGVLSNRYFDDLPWQIREKIQNYRFETVVLNSGVSPYSKFRVYDILQQLKTDEDYSLLRSRLFPNYEKVLTQSKALIEQYGLQHVNKHSVARLLLRIILNRIFRSTKKTDFPGTIESATNIMLSHLDMTYVIKSINFHSAFNSQSIEGMYLSTHEKQDAFFAFLEQNPSFINYREFLEKFQSAWARMPYDLRYSEYTVAVFMRRLDYLTSNLII